MLAGGLVDFGVRHARVRVHRVCVGGAYPRDIFVRGEVGVRVEFTAVADCCDEGASCGAFELVGLTPLALEEGNEVTEADKALGFIKDVSGADKIGVCSVRELAGDLSTPRL